MSALRSVEASGTTLTQIFGVGPILAATILGTVGDVGRFPTKAHFASYSGTAPVEASSGEVVRHRLSLAGNRKLNSAPCTWGSHLPSQVGRSWWDLLPQEAR
jgi:transposase